MTIAALVTGSLFRAPEQRMAKTGRSFVAATIRVKEGDGSKFVSLVAFSGTTQAELIRLQDGDSLSVQGKLTASIYTAADGNANVGLSIVADQVLTRRQPPRERKGKLPDAQPRQEQLAGTWAAASGEPDDSIPF